MYAVNMCYSHCLIIKLIWLIVRHNKSRWKSETKDSGRKKGRVREMPVNYQRYEMS